MGSRLRGNDEGGNWAYLCQRDNPPFFVVEDGLVLLPKKKPGLAKEAGPGRMREGRAFRRVVSGDQNVSDAETDSVVPRS